ncbi:MAG: hypothetical protein ACLR7F_13280 [Waltera sp.]
MDSKLRKMGILASMAVILLVALAVMYVNREQLFHIRPDTEVSGRRMQGRRSSGSRAGRHRGDGHRGSGWQDRQRPESLFKR